MKTRLIDKQEVLRIAGGVSYPTLWTWMRDGKFPRPRIAGGGQNCKSFWRSDEVEQWMDSLPHRPAKPQLRNRA